MRGLQRLVGLLIAGSATIGAGLLWWAVSGSGDKYAAAPRSGVFLGTWHVLYNSEAPAVVTIAAAVGLALLFAAAVAIVETRILNRSRRSFDGVHQPLSPRVVMSETRGVYNGPVTVTVLIPAHNEERGISLTLTSLQGQSHPPERIIVVADNCTDGTIDIARIAGVEVFETVDNDRKKAGGLNQALKRVLPGQGENDLVLVMDADTVLDQGFLESVVRRMTADRGLMAVGGLFYGEEGAGLLGQFQRNEYTRYGRDLKRRRGKVFVLTGTATVFRPRALRTVAAERGRSIPGVNGDVYDTLVLTEDNELTLALKSLGALMISPADCTVVTEVMPTWGNLWTQRLRWQRGALENLGSYGMRPQTFRYWAQQLGIGYGVIALLSYLALITLTVASSDAWIWFPFWLGVGSLFIVERLIGVWAGGWRARLLALLLLPELLYAMFLDVVYVKGVIDISLGRKASWGAGHVAGTASVQEVAA